MHEYEVDEDEHGVLRGRTLTLSLVRDQVFLQFSAALLYIAYWRICSFSES